MPITNTILFQWLHRQYKDNNNRYAFQMAVAFTIAALFVVIDPVSKVFHNPFWMGVAVVTVLDNTVGGFLTLSIQRIFGTIIGGSASIIIITITRAIFNLQWDWRAEVVLCILMFIQIFFISKIKLIPNYSYAGSIGLLTTVIILLSGYEEITHEGLSSAAQLGAWRVCNMIIGVLIAMVASCCVFPARAIGVMRTNLGKSMDEAANLYERSAEYYLDLTQDNMNESLASRLERRISTQITVAPTPENNGNQETPQISIKETLQRIFSTTSATYKEPPTDQDVEDISRFWDHDEITRVSNEAITVLSRLQTESTRLKNVSNEYYLQILFHFLGGGKERCKRYLRRTMRYNEAIEAMKRVVWPLASFRLLFPLINQSGNDQNACAVQARTTPTRETLECFANSLTVMRKLATILKEHNRPLSDFSEDWVEIHRMVHAGTFHAQQELKETIKIGIHHHNMDGLKLLSYYGFIVRCSMIWDGLKTVVDKLSPLNGTLSRASSFGSKPLPNRETLYAPE
ncbi:uncharacterized protein RHIMIDRAFT_282546 [Rhizopus microsporus ATCC 52813]|uniref:DUF2421 domain-containing protein n=2 Tax=Rhizopus microsporus TaxID=58291 RepID=A0A2G4SUX6_RHIZD|nr:uncharacterized protein RHIMIDRAFT_282546 [Rhizopus microsporus ATCC 52813]PHZ12565.1 hypothetical protein RHIMIDRAFT_282546 [Rhizopus microsporus ATCC 52813]